MKRAVRFQATSGRKTPLLVNVSAVGPQLDPDMRESAGFVPLSSGKGYVGPPKEILLDDYTVGGDDWVGLDDAATNRGTLREPCSPTRRISR